MPKVIDTGDDLEALRLEDGTAGAAVVLAPARGGMATRFDVGEIPVLFLDGDTLHDPSKSVRGGVPVLFPIAGKLPGDRYEIGGRTLPMKQHGFARNMPWKEIDRGTRDGASVTLGLDATDATRAQYPFDFALRFTYRLRGETFSIEQRFENRGSVPMPAHPGLHPYFFVPAAAKGGAAIDTDATRFHDNRTGREGVITSAIDFDGGEVDLQLLNHKPRHTVLRRPGLPAVRIGFGDDQAVLVVWTQPGRDFVCVEPWRARSGALADGTAPIIPPGGVASTTLTIALAR